ncbi:MAG: elongation factor G [Caldilineaceae bacterium]
MTKFRTDQIHNIAVLGHGSSGKTMLTEALLHLTGGSTRLGHIEEGTTSSDWDAEEHRRGISLNLSVIPIEFEGNRINLVDTPGYQDFVGEVISALHACEAGLLIVDAVAGVEVGTELVWERLNELKKPRIIFVNRIDRENANFANVLDGLREAFPDSRIVPFQLPIGEAESFKGIVGLVDNRAYMGKDSVESDVPAEMAAQVEAAHTELIEAGAECDDELIMKYLEGEELTLDEVRHALHEGVLNNQIIPVYVGTSINGTGLTRLLRAIIRYVPTPDECKADAIVNGSATKLGCNPNSPPVVSVFKTIIDRFVGRMSYVRVFSGTLRKDANLFNVRTGKSQRIANLFHVRGKELTQTDELVAGDIGVITKLEEVSTGDTLTTADHPITIVPPQYPRPLYTVAVTPVTQADSAKIGTSLASLVEEDPTLKVQNISATKETVLQGMGETHVDVAMRRLESKFGVHVHTSIPKVPYRETVTRKASSQYRHKKQSGGSGQFAEVHMRVEPLPTGSGFEYASEVFGGAISGVYLPSIEKGIRGVLDNGVVAGYPVVDIKAVVFDGKEHPVDSKDIAFQTAGREVFKLAFKDAGPVLLEPIYTVDVTVPDEYMGDIMGDFTTRRGRVQGMDQKGNRTIIHALAPLAGILRYGTDLRSMTQGRGIYTIEFSHYEPVPSNLAEPIIAQHKAEESAE